MVQPPLGYRLAKVPKVAAQPKTCHSVFRTMMVSARPPARNREGIMDFVKGTKAILTDSHFLVPFCVLLAGIALLVVLH